MSTITYIVKVVSAQFTIDDAVAPKLTFRDGDTYIFDQADSSNAGHILQFSITSNNSGSAEYTTGVTKTGTAGSAGSKTTIVTSGSTTDTLYFYSSGGGTYGSEFSNSGFNTSTNYNLLKPIVGAEATAEKWGSMVNHAIDQIDQNITAHAPEGTAVKSTGETGANKFLREDGDNTSSWVEVSTTDADTIPHIITSKLYPAVSGKLLDGYTSHGATYGVAQADGRSYYYTDIKGSKPIKDPRIGAHFGSQRHRFTSLQLLEQETATHGNNVHSIDGREWCRLKNGTGNDLTFIVNDAGGVHLKSTGANSTDGMFIEVVGYFNQANIFARADTDTSEYGIYLDGGSVENNDFDTSAVTPLGSRYVSEGSLSSLSFNGGATTLGVHTLKIASRASHYFRFHGIELIVQDTTSTTTKSQIQIPSQNVVSYGKKFTVSGTPHYDPFNGFTNGTTLHSAVVDTATSLGLSTGTLHGATWAISGSNNIRPYNGGRVVKWVDSAGVIKTSVNMMPPNAQNIGTTAAAEITTPSATNTAYLPAFSDDAVDHSLAEVAKTFHWREFGNGAANQGTGGTWADASMLSSTADDVAYVMDDGLTSLSGTNVRENTQDFYHDASDGSSLWYLTFIGTGLTYTSTVYGAGVHNIVQNLPYGTHVLQCARDADSDPDMFIDGVSLADVDINTYGAAQEFTFHQPKMPPIPEDAVVIADYMLMADFVPQTAAGIDKISKGIRFCSGSRDMFYDQTAGTVQTNPFQPDPTNSHFGESYWVGNMNGEVGTRKLVCFGDSFVVTWRQENNVVPQTYVISAGSDGTTDLTNWTRASNSAGSSGAVAANGTVTRNNGTAAGNYMTAVAGASVSLGVQTIKTTSTHTSSSRYEYAQQVGIHTPIHTSSHYQTFETPFLHELVGGDRNMEQTNLVVTPDGKTWDEVTRKTDYLGASVYANINAGDSGNSTGIKIFTNQRGGSTTGFAQDKAMKGVVYGYDRLIILESGLYTIKYGTYSNAVDVDFYVKVNSASANNTNSLFDNRIDLENDTSVNSHTVPLKRGDYITFYSNANVNNFHTYLTVTKN